MLENATISHPNCTEEKLNSTSSLGSSLNKATEAFLNCTLPRHYSCIPAFVERMDRPIRMDGQSRMVSTYGKLILTCSSLLI